MINSIHHAVTLGLCEGATPGALTNLLWLLTTSTRRNTNGRTGYSATWTYAYKKLAPPQFATESYKPYWTTTKTTQPRPSFDYRWERYNKTRSGQCPGETLKTMNGKNGQKTGVLWTVRPSCMTPWSFSVWKPTATWPNMYQKIYFVSSFWHGCGKTLELKALAKRKAQGFDYFMGDEAMNLHIYLLLRYGLSRVQTRRYPFSFFPFSFERYIPSVPGWRRDISLQQHIYSGDVNVGIWRETPTYLSIYIWAESGSGDGQTRQDNPPGIWEPPFSG